VFFRNICTSIGFGYIKRNRSQKLKKISIEEKEYKVFIRERTLYYSYKGTLLFELNLDDVKLIGEYTNDQGPFFDDWFLVFVDTQNQRFEVSMYSENIEAIKDEVVKVFGYDHTLGLVNSTDWKSIVIWPEIMKGKEFLKLEKLKPKSFLEKLKSSVFGSYKMNLNLTGEVKKLVKK
jgi:hypothetical protein